MLQHYLVRKTFTPFKKQGGKHTQRIVLSCCISFLFSFLLCFTFSASAQTNFWQQTLNLPDVNASGRAMIWGDTLYLIGGESSNKSQLQITKAHIEADKIITTWVTSNVNIPAIYLFGIASKQTTDAKGLDTYIIGGWDGQQRYSAIWHTKIQGEQEPLTWTKIGDFPQNILAHEAVISGEYLYVLGGLVLNGFTNEIQDKVWYTKVNTDGALGEWKETIRFPKPLFRFSVVEHKDQIYVIGGADGTATQANVYRAKANDDGTLSGWQVQQSLPASLEYHQAASFGGRLLVMGGRKSVTEISNKVYVAQLNENGEIESWEAKADMPVQLYRFAIATTEENGSKGAIFLLGGKNNQNQTTASVFQKWIDLPRFSSFILTSYPGILSPLVRYTIQVRTPEDPFGFAFESPRLTVTLPSNVQLISTTIQVPPSFTYSFPEQTTIMLAPTNDQHILKPNENYIFTYSVFRQNSDRPDNVITHAPITLTWFYDQAYSELKSNVSIDPHPLVYLPFVIR